MRGSRWEPSLAHLPCPDLQVWRQGRSCVVAQLFRDQLLLLTWTCALSFLRCPNFCREPRCARQPAQACACKLVRDQPSRSEICGCSGPGGATRLVRACACSLFRDRLLPRALQGGATGTDRHAPFFPYWLWPWAFQAETNRIACCRRELSSARRPTGTACAVLSETSGGNQPGRARPGLARASCWTGRRCRDLG